MFRAFWIGAILLAAACAGVATTRPYEGDEVWPIPLEVRTIPLGGAGARLSPGVRYAGGLILRGPGLNGLSALKLDGDRAWAVSDLGSLVRFTLRLDETGRLVGAESATRRALLDLDGAPLSPRSRADAEGPAILGDGRLLVSFEREHRIWSYGRDGAERPTPVRHPDVDFPPNQGMEGLAAAPGGGWLVLGEGGGAWVCDPDVCRVLPQAPTVLDEGYMFTGADRDPAGEGWFVVERYYRPPLTLRARVRRMAPDGALGPPLIALRSPAAVDNFEGIAAQETAQGVRLYLLSDDNANPFQKTLLLAFDVPGSPPAATD